MVAITLTLGDQERELKFGLMGFFKYVGEVFSGDPLELVNGSASPSKQYEVIFACVYAGLKCAGSVETKEQIDQWVQQMAFEDGGRVMLAFQQAHSTSNGHAGEAEARKLTEIAE